MAVEYEQISDDDLNKSLLGNRATQVIVAPSPAAAPVAEKPRTAVAPPKRSSDASSIAGASAPPVAATVDLPGLVQQVTEGTTQMQENLPKPNTQDSAQQMMDLIGKHWQVPAAIAGTAAAAAILHHIMKKDGGAGPPPPPGGLANPIEPQMSTNQQRPTEPYLESEKPTIQSRTFGSKESMVETGINNKYPFTLQDAKTALGLGNVPIKNAQEAELVAQQYAKQLKAQSSLTEAINTPAPSINNPSPSTTTSAETVNPYENMHPQYNKNKNNIGPGAFNWLAGQEGPKAPEVWQNLVGNKNVSYEEFMQKNKPLYEAYVGSYGEPDPFKQAAKPGSYKTPAMIPSNIKGAVDPNLLGGMAGTALAGYLAKPILEQASQAAGKGDTEMAKAHASELLNFNPITALANALYGENPEELQMRRTEKSNQMIKQISDLMRAQTVGAGRGTTPASAYKR